MKLIVALSIGSVLGTTSLAVAEDVYTPKIVPQCIKWVVPGVGTVCGYKSIDDWKVVLAADAELDHRRAEAKNEAVRGDALALQVAALQDQVGIYARSQVVLVERTEKLSKDLIDLDKKYQDERVKPRFGSAIAWTVAAVAASILVGVVGARTL